MYALQVAIPANWDSNVDELATQCLIYLPQDAVSQLSDALRNPHSQLYSVAGTPGQIAPHILPSSFIVVTNPENSTPSNPSGGAVASSTMKSSTKRTDAIIGVCSAVAGIAALLGIWWGLRTWQKKQLVAHRRLSNLSDPNISNGIYGTQHDDRRTSFFYAEDELRGGYEAPAVMTGESIMTQRVRTDQHTPISPPVLQGSSMNW